MGRLAYSPQKVLWHRDRLAELAKTGRCKPVKVVLILSDLCNQDCAFCAYRMSEGLTTELFPLAGQKNPNRQIPTDKALEIVNDCAVMGVKAIEFTGGGEPTVHKDFAIIAFAAQAHGITTGMVTNGVRLDPSANAVLDMQWIRVSIDSGSEETYCRVRRVSASHWRKMWANVEALAENYEGALSASYVVTLENYREIAQGVARMRDAGIKAVRIGTVFSKEGPKYYAGHVAAIDDELAKAEAVEGIDVINMWGRRYDDLLHGSPTDPFCGYQHVQLYIGGDLGVYRCCNTAYTLHGKMGDLTQQRLVDAWPGLSVEFDARSCQHCQFMRQNAAISAAITEPEHPGFV